MKPIAGVLCQVERFFYVGQVRFHLIVQNSLQVILILISLEKNVSSVLPVDAALCVPGR